MLSKNNKKLILTNIAMRKTLISMLLLLTAPTVNAQSVPMMETGGRLMPDEWIDKDTGYRVVKLTRRPGSNASFYFHNNPFVGNEMLFSGSDVAHEGNDMIHGGGPKRRTQMYAVDLNTLKIRQVTNEPFNVSTEIVCPATHEIFYQHRDSVFALNTDNPKIRNYFYGECFFLASLLVLRFRGRSLCSAGM